MEKITNTVFNKAIKRFNHDEVNFKYIYDLIKDDIYKGYFAKNFLLNEIAYKKLSKLEIKLLLHMITQDAKITWGLFTGKMKNLENEERLILLKAILNNKKFKLNFFIEKKMFNQNELLLITEQINKENKRCEGLLFDILKNIDICDDEYTCEILSNIVKKDIKIFREFYNNGKLKPNIKYEFYINYHEILFNDVKNCSSIFFDYCMFFKQHLINKEKDILINKIMKKNNILQAMYLNRKENPLKLSKKQRDKLNSLILLHKLSK
ncbi:MAG: hypothetical protein ACOCP8_04420 [archaeon]